LSQNERRKSEKFLQRVHEVKVNEGETALEGKRVSLLWLDRARSSKGDLQHISFHKHQGDMSFHSNKTLNLIYTTNEGLSTVLED
jgi:hypothetical protein